MTSGSLSTLVRGLISSAVRHTAVLVTLYYHAVTCTWKAVTVVDLRARQFDILDKGRTVYVVNIMNVCNGSLLLTRDRAILSSECSPQNDKTVTVHAKTKFGQ
jgi:hypothetical protein